MKNITIKFAVLAMFSSIPVMSAFADSTTVNGKPIKQDLIDYVAKDTKARGVSVDNAAITRDLVRNELLVQEAQKQGIDKRPDIGTRIELARREILVNTLASEYLEKNPVTEAELKADYEKVKTALGDKEYSIRHILVASEKDAKDAIFRLTKGEDFSKLAKDLSKDDSKKDGGLLPWLSKGAMAPQVGYLVSGLQKGLYSTLPVQTQDGWHVIKLEDVRDFKAPSFEELKPRLTQEANGRKIAAFIDGLTKSAKIETAAK